MTTYKTILAVCVVLMFVIAFFAATWNGAVVTIAALAGVGIAMAKIIDDDRNEKKKENQTN